LVVKKNTLFVGLDVHAKTIHVAVAENGRDGEVRSLGIVPNRPEAIRKLVKRLFQHGRNIRACYEAGPCGYVLYWQLIGLGVDCEVIAPTLIPQKIGHRVKTDRLDALKLARCHRAGELTAVWVPDAEHEALRDLIRAREAARGDLRSARHRLSKFLLKHGIRYDEQTKNWTLRHLQWLRTVDMGHRTLDYVFQDYLHDMETQSDRLKRIEAAIDIALESGHEHTKEIVAALQLLRGVAKITAAGIAAEIGQFSRFKSPAQLMSYVGVVPSEYSSGGPGKRTQGGITKTGNSHVRRLLIEAAWNYRFKPITNERMKLCEKKVNPKLLPQLKTIASDAQRRLCGRYRALLGKGKSKQVTATAIGRELLGFIWAMGCKIESEINTNTDKRAA
jgi:transposase